MIVELKVNIGTADAARLGITETREGDTVEVPEKAAAEMISKGWAVDASGHAPKKVQAVPPVEVKASPTPTPAPSPPPHKPAK